MKEASQGLNGEIRVVAFDCYGTIMQFADEEFIDAFGEICRHQALPLDGKALWDKWLEAMRALSQEAAARLASRGSGLEAIEPQFVPYRTRWPRYFEQAINGLSCQIDSEAAYDYVRRRLSTAAPYPEVKSVLDALRPHYRLVLLSNADDDWLLDCLRLNDLEGEFEYILSSEMAQSYKPRPRIFQYMASALGHEPSQIAYVGDSPRADIAGAKESGLTAIWIDRYQLSPWPDGVPSPDHRIEDLTGLLPLLLPERG